MCTRLEVFLGGMDTTTLRAEALVTPLGVGAVDLPAAPSYRCKPGHPSPGWPYLPRHPIARTHTQWCRNIHLLPIAYAFRPVLRTRLTLGGSALPRKP